MMIRSMVYDDTEYGDMMIRGMGYDIMMMIVYVYLT